MATSLSRVNWVSLFELMHQTTMRVTDEHVRSEAISIMNMILMSSYSYMEREKFGQKLVFENISQLLNKEAGVQVQKEAVHLLYLLLNCKPTSFCSPIIIIIMGVSKIESHADTVLATYLFSY